MSEEFSCKCCGHCCEGRGGIVVSPTDLARLCEHLSVTAGEFEQRWGERRGTKLHVRANVDNICIFFETGRGCSVHEGKPDICRAWPYFRGNLIDPQSLALAKDFCPGIAKKQSFESFVTEGLCYLQTHALSGTAGAGEAGALQIADILHLAQDSKKA